MGAIFISSFAATHLASADEFDTVDQLMKTVKTKQVLYVPGEHAGEFYTKTVMPSGLSTDRALMTISGNRWTYTAKVVVAGKTTTYRTEQAAERTE